MKSTLAFLLIAALVAGAFADCADYMSGDGEDDYDDCKADEEGCIAQGGSCEKADGTLIYVTFCFTESSGACDEASTSLSTSISITSVTPSTTSETCALYFPSDCADPDETIESGDGDGDGDGDSETYGVCTGNYACYYACGAENCGVNDSATSVVATLSLVVLSVVLALF